MSFGNVRMFVVVLATLFWARTDAVGGSTQSEWTCHEKLTEFCLQLREREITAEAGLCAVIHCSFQTPQSFKPFSLLWFKCEPGQTCSQSDIIFHSKNPNKTQSRFSGRVSLLEPDLSQRNCSIIINDLQLSDSGTYVLRLNRGNSLVSFLYKRVTVSVKALQQKPTVQTPALTEGQRAALTCTAPGLCSGSEPTFTWTWRGAGDAPPNVTTATTDRLTPVSHRYSSTVELTASAELHGAELSCTVSYKPSSSSTQDSVRINVTYPPATVSLLSALIVCLILIVVFIVVIAFLVLRLRTKKPNNEDRVYTSLQRRETSEYEVIARPNS